MSAFTAFFASGHSAPLLYLFLALFSIVTGASPFTTVKIFGPMCYGLLGLTLFHFATRSIHWSPRNAFLLALVTTLYFIPLRLSWDLYKNTLGFSFFLLAMSHLGGSRKYRDTVLMGVASALSILSDQLTSALMLAFGSTILLWDLVRTKRINFECSVITALSLPGLLFYLGVLFPPSPLEGPLYAIQARIFPYDYLVGTISPFTYQAAGQLYLAILLLSALVLVPLLPFAIIGFFTRRHLSLLTMILGIGTFSVIASPYGAIPFWDRWLYMLTFPVLVFASNGLLRRGREVRIVFLVLLVFLSFTFLTLPPESSFPYFTSQATLSYVPSSMVQNTVPIRDCADIVAVISWLNARHFSKAAVVAPMSFEGWARLYLTDVDVYGYQDPAEVNNGNFTTFSNVFLLYWAPGLGWFNLQMMPIGATEIYQANRIGIYNLTEV